MTSNAPSLHHRDDNIFIVSILSMVIRSRLVLNAKGFSNFIRISCSCPSIILQPFRKLYMKQVFHHLLIDYSISPSFAYYDTNLYNKEILSIFLCTTKYLQIFIYCSSQISKFRLLQIVQFQVNTGKQPKPTKHITKTYQVGLNAKSCQMIRLSNFQSGHTQKHIH